MKLTSTHLNPYQQSYDLLKDTPLFNKHDWETALSRGETDLQAYIGQISRYDKLPSLDYLENEYSWSDMDFDQRELLMYAELDANNEERKNYSIVTGYDDEGNEIKQDFELTEKEYYHKVLKEWSDYNKQSIIALQKENAKRNAGFWQSLWYGTKTGAAAIAELGLGVVSELENVVNFFDALMQTGGAIFDSKLGNAGDVFREALSDDSMINLFGYDFKEVVDDTRNELFEWELDNTYMISAADGTRTTAGKLLGDVTFSIGQMLPSLFLTKGLSAAGMSATAAGAVGQGVFYANIFEQNLQERFKDSRFNSVSTENIVMEASIKTGLEYLVEQGLGKLFGVTGMDTLRGISGAGKNLKGVTKYITDSLQEGLEEYLQEFSGYITSNVMSLINEEFRTDISAEQLWDAAVGGFVSSLILGGFYEGRNAIYKASYANEFAKANPNYSKLDDKQKRKFRKELYTFSEAKREVSEAGQIYIPLDGKTKNRFGLSAIAQGYHEVKESIDTSTETGKKALLQLNKQMYGAYKVIMDMYGEIGIERAKSAEALLNDLNAVAEKDSRKFTEQSKFVASVWEENLRKLIPDEVKREEVKTDLDNAEQKTKKKRGRPKGSKNKVKTEPVKETKESEISEESKSEIVAFVGKDADIEQLSTEIDIDNGETVLQTAKELAKLYGHEVVIWDNTEIVEENGKIFAPLEAIRNLPPQELIKSAAERTIVSKFKEDLPKDVKDFLIDKYKEFYNDATDVEDKSVWASLYDQAFYWYMLNRADMRVVNILKVLDNLAVISVKGDTDTVMYKEYNLAVKRIRNVIGPALALYLCNNPDVNFENITVFNDEQIKYIQSHRYNALIAERLINGDRNSEEYKRYLNVLINRINAIPYDANRKADLVQSLKGSSVDVARAIRIVERVSAQTYFGKYNDYYFKEGNDPATSRLNTFLMLYGITYEDLRTGKISSNQVLYDAMVTDIGNERTEDDVREWLNSYFELFTENNYSLEFTKETVLNREIVNVDVVSNIDYISKTDEATLASRYIDNDALYDLTFIDPIELNIEVMSILKDLMLNIKDFDIAYTTVNDIIKNPEQYLSNDTLTDIKNKYKSINNNTVRNYLSTHLLQETAFDLSIIIDENGIYKVVRLNDAKSFIKPEIWKDLQNNVPVKISYDGTLDISSFINKSKLIGDLKNVKIVVKDLGSVSYHGNYARGVITLNSNFVKSADDAEIVNVILHEFQHAIQDYNRLQHGFNENFVVTDKMLQDIKQHVPEIFDDNALQAYNKTEKEMIKWYIYRTMLGEQSARGEALDHYFEESTILDSTSYGTYIVTAWGSKYKLIFERASSMKDVSQSVETETTKPKKKIKVSEAEIEGAVDYQNRINEALKIVKENKAKKVKTFKKDLKHLKLDKWAVSSIIDGTYKISDDPKWKLAQQTITRYKRQKTGEKAKKRIAAGRADSGKGRQIFKKDAEGTNLMYWYDNYKGYIPEVHPAVREFVLSATDFKQLDKFFVEKIKKAELTIWDVNDYIRDKFLDEKNVNDYTFNELKKAFFNNTPFTKFAQIRVFVEQDVVLKAYCVKNALESVGLGDLAKGNLFKKGWKLGDFVNIDGKKSKLQQLVDGTVITDEKDRKKYLKAYAKAYKRLTSQDIVTEKGKFLKDEPLEYGDAKADIALGLLLYFDGTLSKLRYIANNARGQLVRSIKFNKFFTYSKKKGSGGQSTVSLDASVGDDDGATFGDMLADERQNIDDLDARGHYDVIEQAAQRYYTKEYYKGNITKDELGKVLKRVHAALLGMDEEQLINKHALINVLMNNGLSFEEAFTQEIGDLVRSTFDDTKVEIKGDRPNAYKRLSSMVNGIGKYISAKDFNKLVPEEYRKYFKPKEGFTFDKESVKGLTAEQILEIIPGIQELGVKIRAAHRLKNNVKNTANKQSNTNAKNKQPKKKKVDMVTKIVIDNEVAIQSNIDIPSVLQQIFTSTLLRTGKSKLQTAQRVGDDYLRVVTKDFYRNNEALLKLLTRQDIVEILNFFEKGTITYQSQQFPYTALKFLTLAHIIKEGERGNYDVSYSDLTRAHIMYDSIAHEGPMITALLKSTTKMLHPEEEFYSMMMASYGIDLEGEPEVAELVKAIQYVNDKVTVVGGVVREDQLTEFNKALNKVKQAMDNLQKKALVKYKRRKQIMAEDMKHINKKIKRKNLLQVIDIIEDSDITMADAKRILGKDNVSRAEFIKLRKEYSLTQEKMDKIRKLMGDDLYNYMVQKNDLKLTKSGRINKTKHELRRFVENLDAYLFASKHYANDMYNKILKFQKAMMLSNVSTITRNHLSNLLIGGLDYTTKSGKRIRIGGLNDLSDIIGNMFTKFKGKTDNDGTVFKQYNFKGLKVSTETAKFVKEWVVDNNLFDVIGDGLTKYDPQSKAGLGAMEDQLTSMVVKAVMGRIYQNNTYTHDALNTVTSFIFNSHSDDRYIETTALRYLGKMLEFDKTDLSRGMTTSVMNTIAEAYAQAAYDYMHRTNFIADWMSSLRNKHPQAHFVLNVVQPFLASGWNWFIDALQMNPVALGLNIRKLVKLQEQVDKMDEARRRGDTTMPNSRFAEMLVKRNIGKGVVGTFLMGLGFLLSVFGRIRVDREDDKLKLIIGDTYIDFSNIYAATPIIVGAELANPRDGDFWSVIESAFNQQFEDCAVTTLMNTFRYNNNLFDYLTSLPTTVVSSFIPNVWKSVTKLTQNHVVKYDKGFLGDLEYLATSIIPFIEYAMPKGIDPYTGEWEERYSIPAIHQLASAIAPISFKTYKKSDVELAFDDVGLRKNMLEGNYKDVGQLDVNTLNEYYGKLNNETVSKFINDKVRYKVEVDDDYYRELYYSQMNDEQIKSVLDSITKKNANYAKIYTWTTSGHKYYCSSAKRAELIQMGITKNVYIGNKGFVK